jgi:hypothetical protein
MRKLLLFTAILMLGTVACSSARGTTRANVTDEGVVINGVRWATRNVGTPGTFAQTPESSGMFYQWNSRVGWSSSGALVNSNGGTTWNSTPATGQEWEQRNNPCPPGWRVPTRAEIILLREAGTVTHTQNGVFGRLFGEAPHQIFLPAAGLRWHSDGELQSVGTVGEYWNNMPSGENYAWNNFFNIGGSMSVGIFTNRAVALPVRCVSVR